ncbi:MULTISPECIES: DUF3046 domain-containing protein [Nesterenkonia]|uniref:DUF3046 family protein n=1 Tax=Nesterenkonia xinjiangensis TaxID=225327 RepID=A0A7Z0GNA1_9MICC|nr:MULTISPECIES: DUF3046 domain-containing protein [Nesterenkonia]MDZ5076062.1 DUF3046 domain-containing protein [Nesterenkonia sp. HG001]NYJ79155.1 hypothetical protein [Nesterenkonia xinjiangensis]
MQLSRFWFLMEGEFGSGYARVLAGSLVLSGYQKTASEALEAGVRPRDVWDAVCDQQEVPETRRLGRDIPPKR